MEAGDSFHDGLPPPLAPQGVKDLRVSHDPYDDEEESSEEEKIEDDKEEDSEHEKANQVSWKEGEEVDKGPPLRAHMAKRSGNSGNNMNANAMAKNRKGMNIIGMRGQGQTQPPPLALGSSLNSSMNEEEEEKGKKKNTPRGFFSKSGKGKNALTESMTDGAIHEGWLHIRRSGKGSMKKYWFVVTFGGCIYYSGPNCKSKKGNIELKKSSCRVVLRGSASEQSMFGLITQNRDYDLKADAVDDVSRWIQAFEAALTNDTVGKISKNTLATSQELHSGSSADIAKYKSLIDILASSEDTEFLRAVTAPVQKKDERNLAICLIHAFELKKNTLSFLRYLISKSVDECKAATTLFRGNQLTEKALTIYCHLVGTNYLQRCLKPLFLSVVNSDADYEIDPTRVSAGSSVDANVMNLLSVCQMFMAKITASKFTNVPYGIRHVSRFLADITKEKFPDGLYSIIGGLFFLRFVCPALLVPQDLGVYDGEMPAGAKRALLLISKTLMNLSNGVKFGKKENFMIPMNDFIEGNEVAIRKFFDSLILKPEEQDDAQKEDENEQLKLEEKRIDAVQPDLKLLEELTTYLSQNFQEIKKKYVFRDNKEEGEELSEEEMEREEKIIKLKGAIDCARVPL
eukprot:CAMPEP_0201507994 /NCGR_PEP_ID=MMETSP0161_2-20130828/1471_1 /ASSEMBLY_ACC=CAM_ASM_000251 /TAXON_ID=180227 /ORGANISM="Neoparamoeba aestuarina, Strain SoJaBio B1-5/56/2" /LENGTH=627 /DNA_ID=CAMNT_0047902501 /DNA_START=52 /DNA_END=1935 /DNA_ORIENTATION=-